MHRLARLGLLVCVGAVACGRTELDLGGQDTLPVTTGTAGTAGHSSAGSAGSLGIAGRSPTGSAGALGIAGAPTGEAGSPGSTGAAGGVVSPPNLPTAGPLIPCGTQLCQPLMQTCCVRVQNGAATPTCIAATETCDGPSLGCSSSAQCGGGGEVCCVSPQTLSSTCEASVACLVSPGVILCSSDADCPVPPFGNCCGQGNLKICTSRACAGGGGGPGAGGGRGNGGGRTGG